MYCDSLYEDEVFYHDENCWMPELSCGALDRAAAKLHHDTYVIKLTYVDFASATTLCCFSTYAESVDFMDSYSGNGDYLHCYHEDNVVAYRDLCYGTDAVPVRDICDEDIPF